MERRDRYSEGWQSMKLSECITLESGSRPQGGVRGILEGIPSLGGEHLNTEGRFNFEKIRYIPAAFFKSLNRGRIHPNDIIVVKDGATTGKTSFVDSDFPYKEAAVNEHLFIVRVDSEVALPKFVFYYLFSSNGQQQILSDFRGATVGGISRNFPLKVEIPLPPLAEQRRIVAKLEVLFTHLDAAVACLKKVQVQLQQYRRSILKAAFEGALTKEWREEYSAELKPVSVSDNLPKGWVWTTLQQVCSPPQYGWTTKANPQGTLHLLRTTDITTGNVNWETVPYCAEGPKDKEKYLLKTGDILISRAGSVGYSYLVKNPQNAVFASYLIRFKPLPVIDGNYLAFFLKSPDYWRTISEEKAGIALPNVNATKLRQIQVPLPPLAEQGHIVTEVERYLSAADEVEATVTAELARAERLRRSILQQAFSGELVVQDSADEPAERLLARMETEH